MEIEIRYPQNVEQPESYSDADHNSHLQLDKNNHQQPGSSELMQKHKSNNQIQHHMVTRGKVWVFKPKAYLGQSVEYNSKYIEPKNVSDALMSKKN